MIHPRSWPRIRAAVEARMRMGSDIMIVARTDALQSLGFGVVIRPIPGMTNVYLTTSSAVSPREPTRPRTGTTRKTGRSKAASRTCAAGGVRPV